MPNFGVTPDEHPNAQRLWVAKKLNVEGLLEMDIGDTNFGFLSKESAAHLVTHLQEVFNLPAPEDRFNSASSESSKIGRAEDFMSSGRDGGE